MPIFTSERLAKIPKDPTEGLLHICDIFFSEIDQNTDPQETDMKDYIECYALLRKYTEARGFDYNLNPIPINLTNIAGFVRNEFIAVQSNTRKTSQQKTEQSFENFFSNHFQGGQNFELSDGDIQEIQRLTNDLRSRILQTLDLEEKHKQRIISRLEAMQKEIHKVQSNFDVLTGTMCEVLSVIKKAGDAAEPWTRIVKNIMHIAWASQGRVYELSSSIPMTLLPNINE